MKKALILLSFLLAGAFFSAQISYAQSNGFVGVQIGTSPDQSATCNLAICQGEAEATSTGGFAGYSPSFLHIIVQENGTPSTFSGASALVFYSNTSCNGGSTVFTVADTIIPAGSGFSDIYLDLTNMNAVATSGVKCIAVKNLAGIGKTARYNAPTTVPYFDMAATFAPYPTGSFNELTGLSPASSTIFGTNATSSTACDAVSNDLGWVLCTTMSYLFVPSGQILNNYALLPQLIESKFPFSWVASTSAVVSGFTASSTSNFITLGYNFAGSPMASTSDISLPKILPSVTVFSTSTIEYYLGDTTWALFQTLIAAAVWLTFLADVFFTVRNNMHK